MDEKENVNNLDDMFETGRDPFPLDTNRETSFDKETPNSPIVRTDFPAQPFNSPVQSVGQIQPVTKPISQFDENRFGPPLVVGETLTPSQAISSAFPAMVSDTKLTGEGHSTDLAAEQTPSTKEKPKDIPSTQPENEEAREILRKEAVLNAEELRLFHVWQDSSFGRPENDIPLSDPYWEYREIHRQFVNKRKA